MSVTEEKVEFGGAMEKEDLCLVWYFGPFNTINEIVKL